MKTITFLTCLTISLNLMAQLKVTSMGKVGIGTNNPMYQLDVKNTMRFNTWTGILFDGSGLSTSPVIYPEADWYLQLGKSNKKVGNIFSKVIHTNFLFMDSDSSYKMGIEPIGDPLSQLLMVNGYKYYFNDSIMAGMPVDERNKYAKLQYGFLGQELQNVYPELTIHTTGNNKYEVNYVGFIPLLLEAIKREEKQIEELNRRLEALEMMLSENENGGIIEKNIVLKRSVTISRDTSLLNNLVKVPLRIVPNPASNRLEIQVELPFNNNVQTVFQISDVYGKILYNEHIDCEFKTFEIDMQSYPPGLYICRLLIDRDIISKKLIKVE